jgi:long-chain acyl-CoA synthetase
MSKEHVASFIFERSKSFPASIALRRKVAGNWQETSYAEFVQQSRSLAKALMARGIVRHDRVGIFSGNRPEWAVADLGILVAFAVSVPIYATNTAEQTEYIVDDAGLRLLFVGNQEQLDHSLPLLARADSTLELIVTFDTLDARGNDKVITLADFLAEGNAAGNDAQIEINLEAGDTNDLVTIIYTSGTTGEPKGVMLTHANLFHQFHAIDEDFDVGQQDRSLSFLPLSHVFERVWCYYLFVNGTSVSYLEDPKEALNTFAEVRPTAMCSVPRLFEKVYSTAHAKLEKASPIKKALFKWAVKTGSAYEYGRRKGPISPILTLKHRIADKLVLHKVRDIVGGPKNFLAAGGAKLAADIEEFFFACGILVCQGYGLTETSPTLSVNRPTDFLFGTVGKPVKGVEVKIAEDGEIIVRGPNIMKGYWNKPEATREVLTDDGWFSTGDIGEFTPEGYLRITDRKKDLIITSGGKNIAPQRIETIVGQDFYIEQLVAIGDARKFISALVVPNFPALEEWAAEQGISWTTQDELVANPAVEAFFKARIDTANQRLAQYEKVKLFRIVPHEFSQATGELTATLKTRRKFVNEKYTDLIEGMYS